jgi:hypothetical protein
MSQLRKTISPQRSEAPRPTRHYKHPTPTELRMAAFDLAPFDLVETSFYFLSRIVMRPLVVLACTVGLYISSARAGATRNSPGTSTRSAT